MSKEIASPGKIFLAEERGFVENDIHRRYCTFNFDNYYNEHKKQFGRLYTLNDEILPAGGRLWQTTARNGIMLLVPVVGGLIIEVNGLLIEAEAGEVLTIPVTEKTGYTIINPYDEDWINFLHLEFDGCGLTAEAEKHLFDIEHVVNELIPVIDRHDFPFKLNIGRFAGREDFVYPVEAGNNIFGFIIAGAFEFQNRLLHERDGIALWETIAIEAEALSNGAVALLLEMKGN